MARKKTKKNANSLTQTLATRLHPVDPGRYVQFIDTLKTEARSFFNPFLSNDISYRKPNMEKILNLQEYS